MAAPQYLSRAPIQEAIIDIQCAVPLGFVTERLLPLNKSIGYSEKVEQLHTVAFTFQPNQAATSSPLQVQGNVGYRFYSADGKYIAQFRNNGMSVSRLSPYNDWATFYSEACRLWQVYYETVQPVTVSRIAVRNINRLLFPTAAYAPNMNHFLVAPPNLPQGVPRNMSEWMTRCLLHDNPNKLQALLTQVSATNPDPNWCAVILDIDVFRVDPTLPADPNALMPLLATLRDLKNRLFFESLTEEAIALFV